LWEKITGSLDQLRLANELVIIEGAGSPAEPNLAADDIVNMAVARSGIDPWMVVTLSIPKEPLSLVVEVCSNE
jgi:adenosylcobyric acid synthase